MGVAPSFWTAHDCPQSSRQSFSRELRPARYLLLRPQARPQRPFGQFVTFWRVSEQWPEFLKVPAEALANQSKATQSRQRVRQALLRDRIVLRRPPPVRPSLPARRPAPRNRF